MKEIDAKTVKDPVSLLLFEAEPKQQIDCPTEEQPAYVKKFFFVTSDRWSPRK